MSDVLGFLNGVLHRVSATFMPTGMDDVASFLRGDAWVAATGAPSLTRKTTEASSTEPGDVRHGAAMVTTVHYPLGATRWGHFIPLGIAGTALVSAATSGMRGILSNFFESNGFKHVLTLSLVPTEQQHLQQSQVHLTTPGRMVGSRACESAAVSRDGDCNADFLRAQQLFFPASIDTTSATTRASRKRARPDPTSSSVVDLLLDSRNGSTAEAARHSCITAVRRWFEKVEEKSLLEIAQTRQDNGGGAFGCTTDAAQCKKKVQLQRLLVIVRCCTDNRIAFSTRGGGAGGGPGSALGPGRRHRRGEDPLYLFLHELAALTTFFEVRLADTCCAARPAVLLLPEDDGYSGAILRQKLREEVGCRFWVELFHNSDGPSSSGGGLAGAGRGSQRSDGWRTTLISSGMGASNAPGGSGGVSKHRRHEQAETPLARGCRLAAQWGVLHLPGVFSSEPRAAPNKMDTSPAGLPSTDVCNGGGCVSDGASPPTAAPPQVSQRASPKQQEEELRRHAACFFARPSNAPLCVFLMEALRRFPVLVRPVVLQHWQSTWTARHSLTDSLFAFHTALCPFTLSASYSGSAGPYQASSALSSTSDRPTFPATRMLQDTTDLLDALLSAAFTLAEERDAAHPLSVNDLTIEQATLFLLFYEALVHQREGQLRRIPDLVRVLVTLSDRLASTTDESTPYAPSRGATTDEKVHYAVRHLLPFSPMNLFYERVAQLTAPSHDGRGTQREVQRYPMNSLVLPIRRMSVAPQLQHSTLLALLPIGESLMEIRGVAESLWRDHLPSYWRRVLGAMGTCDNAAGAHPTTAALPVSHENPGARALTQLSPDNFYHPNVPHAVRVLYVLTAHAIRAPTEAAKQVPIVQLQIVSQLSDEQLLRVLKELESAGLASTNMKTRTARTLLDTV